MFLESSLDLPKSIFPCEIAKQNLFQNLPISSCLSWSRGKAFWNCSSVSIENILPRGNSGSGVNRMYYNCSLYFKTPISLALWSIPGDLRFRRNDAKSSTIFVKNDHFIAGFSSPYLKTQPLTSCSTFREAILMRMSLLSLITASSTSNLTDSISNQFEDE